MRIINLGSLNYDYVYQVREIAQCGETVASFSRQVFLGGKGLNQSIACTRADADVTHAGCLGADGDQLRQLLADNGVDVSILQQRSDIPSGHAIIQVNERGENCIVLCAAANGTVTPEYIDAVLERFSPGDILLLQNEISCIPYAISKAKKLELKVALNFSPITQDLLESPALPLVDWFIINEVEGASITGEKEPLRILEKMRTLYPDSTVVLTLGAQGAIYSCGDTRITHGTYKVPVVDTTAAGDTFAGYFLACVSRSLPAEQCMEIASKAASLAIGREGAAQSIPYWDEVETASFSYVPFTQ